LLFNLLMFTVEYKICSLMIILPISLCSWYPLEANCHLPNTIIFKIGCLCSLAAAAKRNRDALTKNQPLTEDHEVASMNDITLSTMHRKLPDPVGDGQELQDAIGAKSGDNARASGENSQKAGRKGGSQVTDVSASKITTERSERSLHELVTGSGDMNKIAKHSNESSTDHVGRKENIQSDAWQERSANCFKTPVFASPYVGNDKRPVGNISRVENKRDDQSCEAELNVHKKGETWGKDNHAQSSSKIRSVEKNQVTFKLPVASVKKRQVTFNKVVVNSTKICSATAVSKGALVEQNAGTFKSCDVAAIVEQKRTELKRSDENGATNPVRETNRVVASRKCDEAQIQGPSSSKNVQPLRMNNESNTEVVSKESSSQKSSTTLKTVCTLDSLIQLDLQQHQIPGTSGTLAIVPSGKLHVPKLAKIRFEGRYLQ